MFVMVRGLEGKRVAIIPLLR